MIKNVYTMNDFIPVNTPLLNGNEKKYLAECIDTGWISSEGPFVKEFEGRFASRVNRKFGISVCNGSVALDLAVAALGLGKGDEVIMPSFTIISCAAAIVRSGAVPVLVDSDAETWNMKISEIESRITRKTKAIMVVHIYGLPVDMDPLLEIAGKHGLKIIEDAAEMHGQDYKGKACGSFGDISCFSFYPNKHITTGEGGMIVTDDEALADKCRSMKNLCFIPSKRFVHEELGWNYRFTNIQAALGLAQLERLDEFISRKRNMGKYYTALLKDMDGIRLPIEKTGYADNIYWVYGIVLEDTVPFNAEEAMKRLAGLGIGTRPFFYPMHLQPVFQQYRHFRKYSYPVSENLAERGFYVPSGLALTEMEMDKVVSSLKEILS
jgi:perosamine synthetase